MIGLKKIEIKIQCPSDKSTTDYMMEVTAQTHIKAIRKVLDESCLTIAEKKVLLDKKIDSELTHN